MNVPEVYTTATQMLDVLTHKAASSVCATLAMRGVVYCAQARQSGIAYKGIIVSYFRYQ